MHALLAHATHLAFVPIHLALLPAWRPLLVALAVAFLVRLAGGRAALAASLAVLGGWAAQDFAQLATWPPPLAARLPGLAAIILADTLLRARAKSATWWLLPLGAALSGWWLRGAPLNGPGLVNCMPAFLGFLAAYSLARRLSRGDTGWATLAAALALAGGLWVTGASAHYVRAALVVAAAGAALLGQAEAVPVLAISLAAAAAAAIAAYDRGRLTPLDAACLAPLLVWPLAPALAPRVARSGQAVAGLLAAALCIGLSWAAETALR